MTYQPLPKEPPNVPLPEESPPQYTPPLGYGSAPPTAYGYHPAPPYSHFPKPHPQGHPLPPPYEYHPANVATASSTVVVSQPSVRQGVVRIAAVRGSAPDYMLFSVLMTVICLFFFSGLCILLNVPALVFSAMANEANTSGEEQRARLHGRVALFLNLISLFLGIGVYVGVGVYLAVVLIIH